MISNKYPVAPMKWDDLQAGIKKKIALSQEQKESFRQVQIWSMEQIKRCSPEAQTSLTLIKEFFDSPRFLYANNECAYISAMKTDCFIALQIVEEKIIAVFTDEMAEVTVEAFKSLSNMEKSEFQNQFKKLWLNAFNFSDFDIATSVQGFENMKKSLEIYLSQCEKERNLMAAILTGKLAQDIESLLENLIRKEAKGR